MKNIPRILPLIGVAVGGVLAVNALAGARSLPDLLTGARAFAEGAATPEKAETGADGKPVAVGPDGAPKETAELPPEASALAKAAAASTGKTPLACAPSAADLAKQAGLSPAELRILQSLQARRSELDAREGDVDVQLQLLAAAEAKLDTKIKMLTSLKGDIAGLLGQVDTQQAAEVDRMVAVFTAMKAKDAAARMTLLDDDVRLPIAAKMKERTLSMVLANMSPADAKTLTEKLSARFVEAKAAAEARTAAAENPTPASADPTAKPAAKPVKQAANTPRKAPARPRARAPAAKPASQSAAKPAAAPTATPPTTG